MSVQGTEKRRLQQVVDAQGNTKIIHPETSADMVLVDNTAAGITATTVQGAIKEVADIAKTGGVTGVKGSAETNYRKGDVNITAANIGLGNVNNTSDADKPVSTAQQTALDKKVDKTITVNGHALSANVTVTKGDVGLGNVTNDAQVKRSEMGVANGVATLGADGKVPTAQLPSYVDDVLEFANRAAFPATGETGKIYVDLATNKTYRWGGTAYAEISASLAIGTTAGTAYDGASGKANADAIAALQTAVNTTIPNTYQTKTDDGLDTTANTVVGAINEVKGTADENKTTLDNIIKNGTKVVKRSEQASKLDHNVTFNHGPNSQIQFSKSVGTDFSSENSLIDFTLKIVDGSVGEPNLADDAVTTNKIFNGAVTKAKLATGLGASGTYSAVTTSNGIVTSGGQSIEFGTSGQTAPSTNLMVGGLFFELVE